MGVVKNPGRRPDNPNISKNKMKQVLMYTAEPSSTYKVTEMLNNILDSTSETFKDKVVASNSCHIDAD